MAPGRGRTVALFKLPDEADRRVITATRDPGRAQRIARASGAFSASSMAVAPNGKVGS